MNAGRAEPTRPRRLSSRATPLYKFCVPAGMGIGIAAALWILGSQAGAAAPEIGRSLWMFGGIGAFVAGLLLRLHGGLKQVTLDGDVLVVSNYRDVARVPLHDVERVTPSRFTNPESIRLDLSVPCPFGQRITFLPPQRWVRGFSAHPLAAELAGLVQARRAGSMPPVVAMDPIAWRRVALGALALAAGVAGFLWVVVAEVRGSAAYQGALAIARGHPALVGAIGEPMRETWMPEAHWSAHDGESRAYLVFALRGPRGSARIEAASRYEGGAWRTEREVARVTGRADPIDLLAP